MESKEDMPDNSDSLALKLNLKKVITWLFIITGLLLAAHIAGQIEKYVFHHSTVFGLVPFFDLGNEKNLPTFFQTSILIFTGVLLLLCSGIIQKQRDPSRGYWIALAFGFFYMGIDEWFMLHEKTNQFIRDTIKFKFMDSIHFPWIVLGLVLVALVTLFFFRFLLRLDKKMRKMLILAAVLYVAGAIGLEIIGGIYLDWAGTDDLLYAMLTAVEETLEMVGVIIMVKALMSYLAEKHTAILINFKE